MNFTNKRVNLFFAAIAFILVFYVSGIHNIGITPDSVQYISVAENMQHGIFWFTYDGSPLVIFPVLYPTILGVIQFIFHNTILQFAPLFNAAVFGMVLYLCGVILDNIHFSGAYFKPFTLLIITFNGCLQNVFCYLWSEPIFILFFLLFIISLFNYFKKRNTRSLLPVLLMISLNCITRFAGIVCIPIALSVIFFLHTVPVKQKIKHCFYSVFIGPVLLYANLYWNKSISNSLTGDRIISDTPFFQNLQYTGRVFGNWAYIDLKPSEFYGGLIILLLLIVCLLYIVYKWRNQKGSTDIKMILLLAVFFYTAFIIASATVTKYDPIDNRLLSPVFIPFTILLISLGNLYGFRRKMRGVIIHFTKLCFIGLFIFSFYEISCFVKWAQTISKEGIAGYTSIRSTSSNFTNYLLTQSNSALGNNKIYSNSTAAVYFFAKLDSEVLPNVNDHNESSEYFTKDDHYIFWFRNEKKDNDLLSLDSIGKKKKLLLVKNFKEGAIFYVKNNY